MVKKAKLIVFEGPDGSGKSTLASALFKNLSSSRIPCELHSFPGSEEGTLRRLAYSLHHDSGPWLSRTQRVTKWAETIGKYIQAGCSYGALMFHPAGYMELMEKFAHEVMPSLQ